MAADRVVKRPAALGREDVSVGLKLQKLDALIHRTQQP